jgi:glycerol-3-phosphate dehydrogenase (NAD(P)+)
VATITILGAGNWGTTLALLLHKKQHRVKLWEFYPERASRLRDLRENREFLPGFQIPEVIEITSDVDESSAGSDVLIFALPSEAMRDVARKVAQRKNGVLLLSVSKGLERDTLMRMSEVLSEEVPGGKIASLSGPCIANEVAHGIPTTVVIAGKDRGVCGRLQELLMTPNFRVYTHDDVVGVELGGAFKNVIAVAAGMCDGIGLGANTKGALVTRGLAEITRLGTSMGANPLTFAGLSGVGDLVTTCFSTHSRNRRVGEEIGRGRKLDQVLSELTMVAEGVNTTRCAVKLAAAASVEMPITMEVHRVLFEGKLPREAIADLMLRPPRPEIWS